VVDLRGWVGVLVVGDVVVDVVVDAVVAELYVPASDSGCALSGVWLIV